MTVFRMSPQAVQGLSQDLNSSAKKFSDTLENLIADLDKATASWDGSSKEAYEQIKANWRNRAREVFAIVGAASSATMQIAENTSAAEAQNTATWA